MAKQVTAGSASGEAVAKQLLQKYKNATNKKGPHLDMRGFCLMMVLELQNGPSINTFDRYGRRVNASKMFSTNFKALLITCAVWVGDVELCKSVLSTMKGGMTSETLSELQEPLMANFAKFQELLTDILCQMETVTDVWQCLSRYLDTDSQNTELFEWSKAVLGSVLASKSLMAAADARTLVSMSQRYGLDFHNAWYVKQILHCMSAG